MEACNCGASTGVGGGGQVCKEIQMSTEIAPKIETLRLISRQI